jgi:imidazolonepropionase-like amidohydrolase
MSSRLMAALAFVLALTPTKMQGQATFVVRDVRVFDGKSMVDHRSVLVKDGVIFRVGEKNLRVPDNTTEISGVGRTLVPGLIDAHVHITDSVDADLRQALSMGVTTALDMFTGSTRFERIKAARAVDAPDMASVRTAGVGATAPGGHPSQMGGPPFPTIADSAQAQAFVDARIAEGSDYIKIIYDDLATFPKHVPMLSRATLAGLIAAAHTRGKLAVVHIGDEAQARDAIEAGADGLAHLFAVPTVSPGFAALMARHHAFVVPTVGILYSWAPCGEPIGMSILADSNLRPYIRPSSRQRLAIQSNAGGGPKSCEGSDKLIRELARYDVPILTGTDAPAPGQTYGASLHGELAMLVAAGLTPVQALTAATSAPARAFRLTDRGRIAPGLRADLVLLDGNPADDIRVTRRIVAVWKRGVPVNRVRYDE